MKLCGSCKEEKPMDDFYACVSARDGKQGVCKACSLARNKSWRDGVLGGGNRKEHSLPWKTCRACGGTKPVDEFGSDNCRPGGKADRCRACASEAARKSYAKTKSQDPVGHSRRIRGNNIRRKYGITAEQYDSMFEACGGVCEICGRANGGKPLFVDHCHTSGRVRGLLCLDCNTALGMLRESVDSMKRMIFYVERTVGDGTPAPAGREEAGER